MKRKVKSSVGLTDVENKLMDGHQGGKAGEGWGWWCAELGDWD